METEIRADLTRPCDKVIEGCRKLLGEGHDLIYVLKGSLAALVQNGNQETSYCSSLARR